MKCPNIVWRIIVPVLDIEDAFRNDCGRHYHFSNAFASAYTFFFTATREMPAANVTERLCTQSCKGFCKASRIFSESYETVASMRGMFDGTLGT